MMKRLIGFSRFCSVVLIAVSMFTSATALAASAIYQNDFSSGVGAATLQGSAVVDNGSLLLTPALNSQQGVMSIDPLAQSFLISSWTASFDLAIGPGSSPPADGISFTFGPQEDAFYGEEGMWRFLTVSFDTYDNGDPDHIGIDVKWHNQFVGTSLVNPYTNGQFVPVRVNYHADGTLDVVFNGVAVFTGLQTAYNMKLGDSFGFGGRTGAFNSEHRIDNIMISVVPVASPIPAFNRYGLAIVVLLVLAAGFIGYRRFI